MNVDMLIVIAVALVAVVLFATEMLPIDLVALGIMAALLLIGIVSPEEGIAGFSNTATVTIGAMFVLSAGLFWTGALNFVGQLLARVGRKAFWLALLVMMAGIGLVSAFINNTAAVAIFLPIALGVARDAKASPSKLLMPLSFASMFGGVCTLIGSSTNILVSSIAERHGLAPFGMFEFAPLGLVMFAVGFVYMGVAGIRLIPERRKAGDLVQNFGMGDYLTDFVLLPEAKSVGKPLGESPLVRDLDLEVIDLFRGEKRIRPLSG
ncbi:MAG TPA: sodium:proton antiporter, partial [Nitrospiria bacterium]|nr:sodium:proton antiporter [Nitrospiria bacterium]